MPPEQPISTTVLGDPQCGGPLLVVLPGALFDGPNRMLERLARGRPVLLVRYGQVGTMAALADAIMAEARVHGDEPFDLLGTSFGGWVAQCLAERHPDGVRNLVLAHSFALRPGDARKFRTGLRIWSLVPRRVLRTLIALRARRTLSPLRLADPPTYLALVARVNAALDRARTIDDLMSHNRCMLDSLAAPPSARANGRPDRVLILESTDDPVIRRRSRHRLRSRFPGATVHTFAHAGHVSALLEPDAVAHLVGTFLDRDDTGETARP